MEGALAAIELWSKGGGATIAKETNLFTDYINRANQEKLQSIEKMGVTIVNGLEELKEVLE